jgi:hypothetical protein
MLWRLQYATKGRNSFVKMYALDLSPNGIGFPWDFETVYITRT